MKTIPDPLRYEETEMPLRLNKWPQLGSIHKLTRKRYDKKKGTESVTTSYFISSPSDSRKVFDHIRSHRAIENNLHYCLDVTLGDMGYAFGQIIG